MNALLTVAFLLPMLGSSLLAQNPAPNSTSNVGANSPPLDRVVAHYELTDSTLLDGMAELSRNPDLPLHLGIEEILRQNYADPRDRSVLFSLNLENRTIRGILNALCDADRRYVWSTDGVSINVYARARADDKTYLLNRRIQRIELNNIASPYRVFKPLAKLFPPPEPIGYLRASAADLYSEPWTIVFEDLTVRTFIDRVAEHIGPRSSWVWQGDWGQRGFTFFDSGLP
jgi:hypothetical protein